MKDKRAIVVGAGLGGLSAAAYLARAGLEVDVFERNSYPGGYACSFVRGPYEFEASLHELSGIGPPGNRGSCYRVLEGCDVARRVEFLPIDDFYTSIFPDFTVRVPHGWEAAEEAYCDQFPRERKGISRVMQAMRRINDASAEASKITKASDALTLPFKAGDLVRSMGITVAQALDREMKDPGLKALFTNIWGYYGLPPSRLSWLLFAVANASYIEHGPYHVKGTTQALSNAFVESIEDNGGRVHLRDGVVSIEVADGRATGVVTGQGGRHKADFVVCSANPITTCFSLIGPDKVPADYLKALAGRHIAVSTFNVYMGLDHPAADLGLDGHEFFINEGYDYDDQYLRMFTTDRPSYWAVTNYNHADPEFSPPGTSVVVLTALVDYTPWAHLPADRYRETKDRIAREMIEATDRRFPGLKDHLAVVEVSTPITNMRYSGNPGGSILGFDYDLAGSPPFRLSNRGPLERLFFANAWVRMGGGMETCITSGLFAYGEVMKDLRGTRGLAKLLPATG
ncbi:MAG: NAD(P)/FAD-dependent oxidoreductase [Actinobacteria bacterium]|nr:NAD(P)/FAD-dependent oxidoreductase [Actinomycetota bacterium]MBU1944299.1 NAD(P)/FAD-dependent oxidoreductase [Actinomycetota bacterium]MBU2688284.1 NAD(P)/FAD-dependent oxidoreductase [Actinomycetota bacterium]